MNYPYVKGVVMPNNCPRRAESWTGPHLQGNDVWDEADDTCSYCGSLNPDELLARIEAGTVELIPTDKNYKVYVENDGGEMFKQHYRNCYDVGVKDCPGPAECEHWVVKETSRTKFYFQHFNQDQKRRFVELYNEKRMKLGYPGHFYVKPFFVVLLDDKQADG